MDSVAEADLVTELVSVVESLSVKLEDALTVSEMDGVGIPDAVSVSVNV